MLVRAHDPLTAFQFGLRFLPANGPDGSGGAGGTEYIAGVSRVSGLSVTVTPTEVWSGGNNRHPYLQPDKCTWDAITLEQGLALDGTMIAWAEAVVTYASQGSLENAPFPLKRNLALDVWNPSATLSPSDTSGPPEGGTAPPRHPMYSYVIHNAWISRYEAMPSLDAMGSEVAFMSVDISHEGWHRTAAEPFQSVLGEPGGASEPGDFPLPDDDTDTRFA